MRVIKKTKKLEIELKLVNDSSDILENYFHLGVDNNYYVFKLNEYSVKHINYFINKKLIYVK